MKVIIDFFKFYREKKGRWLMERQIEKILTLIGAKVSKDPAREFCLKIKIVKKKEILEA